MIVTGENGRHTSVRTKEEKIAAIRDLYKSMDEDERDTFHMLAEEFIHASSQNGFDSGDELGEFTKAYNACAGSCYDGEVVDIDRFLWDEYYMGRTGRSLYPKWKDSLKEIFAGDYNEAIITGSIGGGKTTFAEFVVTRMVYELEMLRDPQAAFGLMPGSEIVIVCYNRDQKLAKDVTFGGVKAKLEMSPFFAERCKFGINELVTDKNIRIIAASSKSANALGRNVFGGIIDEAEFLTGKVTGDAVERPGVKPFVEVLYHSIITRMKSRYERVGGAVPGIIVLSSSARNKNSFTNKRVVEARMDPKVFCRDYATWDVKEPYDKFFSRDRFVVLVGNARIRHRILTTEEYRLFPERDIQDIEKEGCSFIHVPMNFISDFQRDIESSIRDLAGIVTVPVAPYIQVKEAIYNAVDETYEHPLTETEWATNRQPYFKWDKLVHKVKRRVKFGHEETSLEPIRHPGSPRHVHIDLSLGKTDAAGMCIAHVVDWIDVERRSLDDLVVSSEKAPVIEVDLLLRILAPTGGEVDIGACRAIVYEMINKGYTFGFASLDSWQSAESLQKFRANNIKAEKVSVDASTEPYDYLKLALYEGRLSMYKYPIVLEELESLQMDQKNNQVVHPSKGTKDVADALAGVVYTLSTRMHERAPLMIGISKYEGQEEVDSDWIRRTMKSSGDALLEKRGNVPPGGGPVITSG